MDLLITHATVLSGDPDNALMEDAVIGIKDDRIAHLQVRDTINPLPNADRLSSPRTPKQSKRLQGLHHWQ